MKRNVKKLFVLCLAMFCIFAFTGCDVLPEVTHETTEIQTTVIACNDGELRMNAAYLSTANIYLAQGNTAMFSMYYNMAITYGKTIYTVTIHLDGNDHKIEREEKYTSGQTITVTKKCTFEDGRLVETKYS